MFDSLYLKSQTILFILENLLKLLKKSLTVKNNLIVTLFDQ